jgi:site-specific DNA-methyltransferase (adenine-specific)
MKTLPDKSIDCFICDLPYGQIGKKGSYYDAGSKLHKRVKTNPQWDVKISLQDFWIEVDRLKKDDHTPILHFCNTKFGIDLINSNPKWFRYDLVWNKERPVGPLSANIMPLKCHEMLYVFSKKSAKYQRIDTDGKCPVSVLTMKSCAGKKHLHPTAKPHEIYRWLLQRYCISGGTVLDPTAGSCHSVEVARELGFNAIGIEMCKVYYDDAVKRLL